MNDSRTHWEKIYKTKAPNSVSWFQPSLRTSLRLIQKTGLPKDSALIDVGGGASTLVDDLISSGYSNLTVLDISAEAIGVSKERLGPKSAVHWIIGDITELDLSNLAFDLWHDRALFHFLTTDPDRRKYCAAMHQMLRPGGFAIVATFGPNGPLKCSGLEIVRYSPESLHQILGRGFSLIASEFENHVTPGGAVQEFAYSLFQRTG